jgi:mannose-6-phosphate isomerase-like protein (cupin superfamily)
LIVIVTGRGVSVCEGVEMPIEPDMALWVRAGEAHQLINTGHETMKLVTMFIPPYTAEELYHSCLEAARKDAGDGQVSP